jgi:hypothetical protein
MYCLRWAALAMSAAAMTGCSLERAPVPACATETCFTQFYFEALPAAPDAACSPVAQADRLDHSLALSLFWGGGADDMAVAVQGSRLQRFFRPYNLQFYTAHRASDSSLAYAMRGSRAQLDAALAVAGIPVDRPLTADEQHRASRAAGAIIFAELGDFVRSHSQAHTVNMVVLEHILAPELADYLFEGRGPTIVGFAVSPQLFAQVSTSDPQYDLWEMTGLSGDFTPALFIGDADVGALRGTPDNVIAHEMGHALGLPHSNVPGNLMTPGPTRSCDEELSPGQLAQIRHDVSGGAPDADVAWAVPAMDWIPTVAASVVRAWQVRQVAARQRAR